MKRRSLESAEKGPVPLWRQMTKGSSPRWFLFLRFFHWLVHTQWADACYKVVATISFGEFVTFFFQYSPSVGAKVTDAPCLTLQYFCIKRENGFNVFGIINERLDWYSFCRKRAAPCGLPPLRHWTRFPFWHMWLTFGFLWCRAKTTSSSTAWPYTHDTIPADLFLV